MKITKISVYQVPLPAKPMTAIKDDFGTFQDYSGIVVVVETDAGFTGLGEVCTIGTHYMRGFAEGAAAGIPLLARHLIGEDPFHAERLNRYWDKIFRDDLYIKAPLDIALWDIMGQATGRPVCDLLGGRYDGEGPLYRSVYFPPHKQARPADIVACCLEARQNGFKHFQLKPGKAAVRTIDDEIAQIEAVADIKQPHETILVDANTNWTLTEAIRAANALKDLPVIIEQPCRTWEECIAFRRQCVLPVKLDELIETPQDLIRGFEAGAMDIVAIKIARVGGLTKARKMRDLALDLGITVVPDDAWGSQIVSSSLLHFAASTDPKYRLCYTDLTDYVDAMTADGYPERVDGSIAASSAPGLGLTLRPDAVGEPIAVIT
ncbi:MAG: mandelate racemase/muconate lactonizing enzyme family protein [Pseudomonadota bacterium]